MQEKGLLGRDLLGRGGGRYAAMLTARSCVGRLESGAGAGAELGGLAVGDGLLLLKVSKH